MRYFIAFAVLCLFSLPAQAATLKLELASDRVDITTGFNGTRVVLFGTTDTPDADIAVTLKGPENKVIVRRKGRVAGAWMNSSSMEFRRVPTYYDYAATKSDATLAPLSVLQDNQIGIDQLAFYPEDSSEDPQVIDYFRDALTRTMQRKGFYPLKSSAIIFVEPQFFKVVFDLPPGVPTGIYSVEGVLIENQAAIAKETKNFQVGQVGFNAKVYNFATKDSFFYGIFAILLALFSGWSAFTFLRRD